MTSILADTIRQMDQTDKATARLDALARSRGIPLDGKPEPKAATTDKKPDNQPALYTPQKEAAHLHTPPKLAYEPNILKRFGEIIEVCGVVGEVRTAKMLYLVITTRLLLKPVSAAVKGLSSSGKSFTTEKTVEFFPKEAVILMTAMSERALIYSKEDYAHRTLILYEATALREGAEDNLTAYFVRSLLSEGRIEYPVTVRDPAGGFMTKTIIKNGPTGLILTTTKPRVHAENETRLLSLNTNDTREQTKAIFHALASETTTNVDQTEWHQLQRWLQEKSTNHTVTIPYASQLAELISPVAVRLRRDFAAVLALIRAHAILHQQTRETDAAGQIIATIDDYVQVRELVADLVAEGVGSTVSPTVRETVKVIEDIAGDTGVTVLAVADKLKLDRTTVARRLSVAAAGGYIKSLEDKRGKPGRWIKGDELPGSDDLLPTVHTLTTALNTTPDQQNQGVCRCASTNEGIEGTPLEPQIEAAITADREAEF
ncbi:MAG: hypothetical protein WBR29_04345 [Gammaproteobacteria bacterium]